MPEPEKRKAMCLHCGLEVFYTQGDGQDQARAWKVLLDHDGVCPKNPLVARIVELEADAKRLDTLERLLLNHPMGREYALQSDYEDGIWVAEVLRGSLRTMPLEDPFKDQVAHKTLRAAIDAIALPTPAN